MLLLLPKKEEKGQQNQVLRINECEGAALRPAKVFDRLLAYMGWLENARQSTRAGGTPARGWLAYTHARPPARLRKFLNMRQTIENAKQAIAQKKILWAYPIALKLQKYHYSLAIQWAVECIKIYSSEFEPDKLAKLNKYIQQALDSQNVLTPLQCSEIGKEIWYLPEREEVQTAIARLWWSIAAFKSGDEHIGIMEAISPVEVLLPDTSDRNLLDRYLEAAVRIYEEYESRN